MKIGKNLRKVHKLPKPTAVSNWPITVTTPAPAPAPTPTPVPVGERGAA